ncbi:MAG: glycosyltransferase family 2 protein, partial [Ruthenibacterium sp.]
MKKISIVIPCFNEQENVEAISSAVVQVFDHELQSYDYEIIMIDNFSTDRTRPLLEMICAGNSKIKAIFNRQNFGQFNSPYYGILQSSGDATILMAADFQDPVEMIPAFVHAWEEGHYSVVCGVKTTSKESGLMYFLRSFYYKIIQKMSNIHQIEHFTGFGLYDSSFVETLRSLKDPTPFLRGIVAEYAPNRKEIPYGQPKRRA